MNSGRCAQATSAAANQFGAAMDPHEQALRQLEARTDLTRKQKRHIRREVRAMQYAFVARRGGGEHECARRQLQGVTS
jgi:hypothetical protein